MIFPSAYLWFLHYILLSGNLEEQINVFFVRIKFNCNEILKCLGGINPFMIGNNGAMGQQPQSPTTLNFNPFITQQTQCNFYT